MTSSNIDVVQNAYRALQSRDVEALTSLLHADHVFEQSDDVPWGGRFVGVSGFLEFFGRLHTYVDSSVSVDTMIDAGSRVAVVGRTKGTVRSNGAAFDVPFCHVYDLHAGRIVHALAMIDHPTMLAALQAEASA